MTIAYEIDIYDVTMNVDAEWDKNDGIIIVA